MNSKEMDTAEYAVPASAPEAPLLDLASAQVMVDLAGASHQGKVRSNNEDHYLAVRFGRALQTLTSNLPAGCIPGRMEEVAYGMVVADGMGGMAAGEVASRMAITTLVNLVLDTPDWIMRLGEPEAQKVQWRVARRYRQVDAALREQAQVNPSLAGMGTTMTLAASLAADLFVANVGDSRAYLMRQGDLFQLTRDQNLAQDLVDQGLIRQADVATHQLRHVLTCALGGSDDQINAEIRRLTLADDDQILLCTDGLTDMVNDETIGAVLRGSASAQATCQFLIELALQNGGKDNVTVMLARYRFPAMSRAVSPAS